MSLMRLVESDRFGNALIVLLIALAVYLIANRPPMRPTDPAPPDVVERNPAPAR
jgi:hypothetical protein